MAHHNDDADVPGYGLIYEQLTRACYGLTVGKADLRVATKKAEYDPSSILGEFLVIYAIVSHDVLDRYGVWSETVVLTNP